MYCLACVVSWHKGISQVALLSVALWLARVDDQNIARYAKWWTNSRDFCAPVKTFIRSVWTECAILFRQELSVQVVWDFIGGQGVAKVEALNFVAVVLFQKSQLPFGFHAFRNQRTTEIMS